MLHQVLRKLKNPVAMAILGHTPPTVKTSTLEECQGIAAYLNKCEHTSTIYSYRVEPCIDTIDDSYENITKLSEVEVNNLYLTYRMNEQWLEDYRDGLELWQRFDSLGLFMTGLEQEEICPACNGRGKKHGVPCPKCGGGRPRVVSEEPKVEKKGSILDNDFSWRKN